MNPIAMHAWLSLYLAASILAALCALLAAIRTGYQLQSGALKIPLDSVKNRLLACPRVWVAWQLSYLRGTPVVLAICVYFAWYLGFGRLGNV